MILITHIRLSPQGTGHEHITDVKWQDPMGGSNGQATVSDMVEVMLTNNVKVYVRDGTKLISVEVIDKRYLRTRADGKLSNNLLALERF